MQSERALTQAAEWVAQQLRENPQADRSKLIDQASQQFNLSPLQAEFLLRRFLQGRNETPR